jgi:hypothetical protein
MSREPKMQIFLIRHAKPDVSRSGFFNHTMAKKFIEDYHIANIVADIEKPDCGEFTDVDHVYCSTLNRSKQTAKLLFGEHVKLRELENFREFESRIVTFPALHLPLGFWLFISRLLWFLGLNKRGIESYREGRKRARIASKILHDDAVITGKVVLVAHGFLNFFLRHELKKLGWVVTRKGGRGYLGITALDRFE